MSFRLLIATLATASFVFATQSYAATTINAGKSNHYKQASSPAAPRPPERPLLIATVRTEANACAAAGDYYKAGRR